MGALTQHRFVWHCMYILYNIRWDFRTYPLILAKRNSRSFAPLKKKQTYRILSSVAICNCQYSLSVETECNGKLVNEEFGFVVVIFIVSTNWGFVTFVKKCLSHHSINKNWCVFMQYFVDYVDFRFTIQSVLLQITLFNIS